jgi:NTE family protein
MTASHDEPRLPLVAIACQGGGSHAAFGAGVIHRLLEDHGRRFRLHALSGTSGGAVNAVLAWSGLIQDGADNGVAEAQRRLHGMWQDLGAASVPDMIRNWWGQLVLDLPFTWEVSPYVWDLGARDEMISRLRKWANLERLPQDQERLNQPVLFVGATDILNGVSVAIRGDGTVMTRTKQEVPVQAVPLAYDDVIASLAIPPLYKDVQRRGTAYWDGLFSINPPVHALTQICPCPDEIWVIQINPQRVSHAPAQMRDIVDRRNELGGNVSLNKELDMIETVNGMIAGGHLRGCDYRHITVRIVGLEEKAGSFDLSYASKFDRSPGFLRDLFDHGRSRASEFYDTTWSLCDNVRRRLAARTVPKC